MRKNLVIVSAFVLSFCLLACAQNKPSPPASAQCKFSDGKTVKVDYSSPRAKGRKIYGDLVPFGQVWRTGANEATTFVTDASLKVGGKDVPAGNYTIFTVPNQDKWTLIVNKKTGEWGIPYKYESDELTRADMEVSKTAAPVENFTISFHEMGNGCHMYLDWENTRATILIEEKK
jgi:Protein of unknown function (DUF2911)